MPDRMRTELLLMEMQMGILIKKENLIINMI